MNRESPVAPPAYINRGITRVMPLLVDPIQTDLVYVQESEGVFSLGEGIVLLAFLLVE